MPYLPDETLFSAISCFTYSELCLQQFLSRLIWLGNQLGLNFKGIKQATWFSLVKANKLSSLVDWLDWQLDDLSNVPNIGKKQSEMIIRQFQLAKKASFSQWLNALGMTGLPESIKSYCWQELMRWDIKDWQNKLSLSTKRATLYYQLAHEIMRTGIANTLIKIKIDGF
ncbi:hypothetical protein [Orbus mooreae]|uniref:hypothetical protein n=1 Tax=Orbus mooreae TaxID=3074107 RepID=UPI00370DCE65